MGLTKSATGRGAAETDQMRRHGGERLVALAGNPNVGKSTLFNLLTGMRQHTGNWAGKTVGNAFGYCTYNGRDYCFADIPGAYSLAARSAEEEVARDFICYGGADAVVVVCDATCLRRTLALALQVLEITENVIICVNLLDEAGKKGIAVKTELLSEHLGVPVIGMSASRGEGEKELLEALGELVASPVRKIDYGAELEDLIAPLETVFTELDPALPARWLALRALEDDRAALAALKEHRGIDVSPGGKLAEALGAARRCQEKKRLQAAEVSDRVAMRLIRHAAELCEDVVISEENAGGGRDRRIDKVLTHPVLGYPVMLLMLAVVLWITIAGANVPSQLLSEGLFRLGDFLKSVTEGAGLHATVVSAVFDGVYRTVAWVVAVMLPPMAIFFPLFTLLEDLGYLPRVAFNLDGLFKKCSACGKQGLTMCMGLGCNAAGVVGCRIIDSPRERLIAMLTNSFVPCNGRLPQPGQWQQ